MHSGYSRFSTEAPSSIQPPTEDDLWLSFGPYDHARLLHGEVRKGKAVLASASGRGKKREWHETPVALGDERFVANCSGNADCYLSYHTFARGRRTRSLVALCALHADVDFYKLAGNPIADLSPAAVAALILAHLASRNLPLPSIVLDTGRGLGLTWLIDPIPAQARTRWLACQRALGTELAPFGHDRAAIDAARLTRLVGTRNGVSGRTVRMLPVSTCERHDFEVLAARLLPYTRAEIHNLKAVRRARRRAPSNATVGPRPRLTSRTLHEARIADLRKLVHGRYAGFAPPGHRNAIILIASASLAFLVPPAALEAAIVAIGAELAGWSAHECLACAASVISRAARHTSSCAPYRYSTARIVADLAITEDEMRGFDLRTLRTDVIARERDRARKDADRRRTGSATMDERRNEERRIRQRATDLAAKGWSARRVGEEMGLSRDAVNKLLQRARAEGLTPADPRGEQR
jgi:hypothetical protein